MAQVCPFPTSISIRIDHSTSFLLVWPAQRHRPQTTKVVTEQSITHSTSLATVNSLLETGIGCISYLRGLFNEDNFENRTLSCPKPPPAHGLCDTASSSQVSEGERERERGKNVSTVKVKKLVRGVTGEADQLLDYIVGLSRSRFSLYVHY